MTATEHQQKKKQWKENTKNHHKSRKQHQDLEELLAENSPVLSVNNSSPNLIMADGTGSGANPRPSRITSESKGARKNWSKLFKENLKLKKRKVKIMSKKS